MRCRTRACSCNSILVTKKPGPAELGLWSAKYDKIVMEPTDPFLMYSQHSTLFGCAKVVKYWKIKTIINYSIRPKCLHKPEPLRYPETGNTWYWYWAIGVWAGIGIGIEIPIFQVLVLVLVLTISNFPVLVLVLKFDTFQVLVLVLTHQSFNTNCNTYFMTWHKVSNKSHFTGV